MQSNNTAEKKYQYIDALRGIAILGVILIHVGGAYPPKPFFVNTAYGELGVQLFFVASALTLCLSMERRHQSPGYLKAFFIRRYFRIAPLYYIGILVFFAINYLAALTNRPNWVSAYSLSSVAANVFFIHGFIPAYNNNVVPGGWSIGTEMAFYLIFPFLFSWLKNKSFNYIALLLIIYAVLTSGALWLYTQHTHQVLIVNNNFYYNNLFNQMPVFLWGFLLYKQVKLNVVKHTVGKVALLIVGVMMVYLCWNHNWVLSFFFVPAFAGMAFFALAALMHDFYGKNIFLEGIGQLSYSVYIMHFLIVWWVFPTIYKYVLSGWVHNDYLRFILHFVSTVILSVLLSKISEKYIEKPFVSMGNNLIQKLNTKAAL